MRPSGRNARGVNETYVPSILNRCYAVIGAACNAEMRDLSRAFSSTMIQHDPSSGRAMNPMNRREALERIGLFLGGALAAPTVAGVLGGCRAESEIDWQPVVFSSEQAELLTVLTDRIVPETDTPGAAAVGVPGFIDRMLAEWYPERLRRRFLEGLDAFEEQTARSTSSSFVDLSVDRQQALLAETDLAEYASSAPADAVNPSDDPGGDPYDAADSTGVAPGRRLSSDLSASVRSRIDEAARRTAARRPGGGPIVRADAHHEGDQTGNPSFFRMLKELTLVGYYTSEAGAGEELRFVQVPGRWEACMPLEDVGRTWAI